MKLVDVHCHLDDDQFKHDLPEAIARAQNAGLDCIITHGTTPLSNRAALKISNTYPIVKTALGIYPLEAVSSDQKKSEYLFNIEDELMFIKEQTSNLVAIGEIGLDFSLPTSKDLQIRLFEKLLDLAKKMKKPVVVHSRKAEQQCIETLESTDLNKVVLHCFSGRKHLVRKALDNGWCFSIPANVVRSHHFQSIVNQSPLSQILTETDSPCLSPFKDTRNEPAFVIESVKKIAQIKKQSDKSIANRIYENYQRLFQ
jgi:TatD DNase family protein